MRTRALLAALLAPLALGACSDAPKSAECEALLANAVAIELRGRGVAEDKLDKRAAKVTDIAREEYLAQCMKTMSGARVRCGIDAKDRAALEACDGELD